MDKDKTGTGFAAWFRLQFGGREPLPPKEREALRERLQGLASEAAHIRADLMLDDEAQLRYTAALYAWQVSEEDKRSRDWDAEQRSSLGNRSRRSTNSEER